MEKRKFILSILLICFVTSCSDAKTPSVAPANNFTPTAFPTNTPIPLVANKATVLFQQDFESGVPSGITVWSKWDVVLDDVGNHIFCNLASDDWTGTTFGHDFWSDYAIELRVKFLDIMPDQSISVDSRKNSNSSEKYSGDLHYGGAELNFFAPYIPMGNRGVDTNAGIWYTLRLEAAENHFRYYINDELIAENFDDNRQQGFGGLSVSPQSRACFDDIHVWALTKDGSFAQAPTPLTVSADIPLATRLDSHKFPKLFIQNQELAPTDNFLNQSSYWDIITLDIEAVTTQPDYLGSSGMIRAKNPNSVVITYFSAADITPDDFNYFRTKFSSEVNPDWYMRDIHGEIYHLFPLGGEDDRWTQMFNLSTDINTFMPDFLGSNVMNTGQTDGIFYDWINESFAFLKHRDDNPPNSHVDINLDGQADTENVINTVWSQGTIKMLSESRKVFPPDSLIIGNGGGNGSLWIDAHAKSDGLYKDLLNGRMLEGFVSDKNIGWLESMRAAALMDQAASEPKVPLFMARGNEKDFEVLRYTLASSLMFNGYFTMTTEQSWLDADPYSTSWWYDEYSVDFSTGQAVQSLEAKGYLGYPLTDGYNAENNLEFLIPLLLNNDKRVERIIWRRDFQNGIALVNPSKNNKIIDLNGSYRKILGAIDPDFNNGTVLTEVDLPAHSGIILLKMP